MKVARVIIASSFLLGIVSGCTTGDGQPEALGTESEASADTETGTQEIKSIEIALPNSPTEEQVTLNSSADFDAVLDAIETGTGIGGPVTTEEESVRLWINYQDGNSSFYYLWLQDSHGRFSPRDGSDRSFLMTPQATEALRSLVPND